MSSGSENYGSRTILWCVPRCVSTALMKCLSFIEDIEVWCEHYAYSYAAREEYMRATNGDLPMEYEGNEEVFQKAKECLDAMFQTSYVPDRISFGSAKHRLEQTNGKHVFVKDMGFGIPKEAPQYLPEGYKHTFLIRNPIRTIYSYRRRIFTIMKSAGLLGSELSIDTFDVERDDWLFPPGCYVKEQYDLWRYVKKNIESNPVVIDANELLTKPKETLSAYCAAVGLPYSDSLLQWDASADVLKTVKAPGDSMLTEGRFYKEAVTSSRFLPPSEMPPRDQLTPDVIRCSERVMKYYEEMYEERLKV